MRVNCWWIAFAVPIVFDCVLDANGAFIADFRAVADLVFDVVGVGFDMHGLCLLTNCGF